MARAKPDFEPRRADEAGQVYTYNDADGEVEIRADKEGVIRPKSDREARAADAFDLPVARKVQAAERAEAKADADATPAPIPGTADNAGDAGKEG